MAEEEQAIHAAYEKRDQEWEQHLADQVRLIEQAGGQFTQMNKMKLKLQWEMKMKL